MVKSSFLATLLLFSVPSQAARIDLSGTVGYRDWTLDSVNIFADRVANLDSGGSSGTLFLELLNCDSPSLPSHCVTVATHRLGELAGGQYFYSISSGTISAAVGPLAATGYIIVGVVEYPNLSTISDYAVVRNPIITQPTPTPLIQPTPTPFIQPTQSPGHVVTPTPMPQSSLNMSGNSAWRVTARGLKIRVQHVSNGSKNYTSGSLRLRLWATDTKFEGGEISGYILGKLRLNPLPPGYEYTNTRGLVRFRRPPSGSYFTTITLDEFDGTRWIIRDYTTFDEPRDF